MKILFILMYIIYIGVTLTIMGITLGSDLKRDRIDSFTFGYQSVALGFTIFMNYDMKIFLEWWGVSGKSMIALVVVAIMSWILYGYYPRCHLNPFWKHYYGWF